jgi:Transposase
MSIVETSRSIVGGVDTHLDVHVAAAVDANGGRLGVRSFPTTPAGYHALLSWLSSFGPLERVGVEGTGAYGAGLAPPSSRSACHGERSTATPSNDRKPAVRASLNSASVHDNRAICSPIAEPTNSARATASTRTCKQDRARGSTSGSGSQGWIAFPAGSGGDVTSRTEGTSCGSASSI